MMTTYIHPTPKKKQDFVNLYVKRDLPLYEKLNITMNVIML